MTIALELRGIRKRYTAGVGACRAFVDVLRGVDLVVRGGECVVVVGQAGTGKSTLLLCAAALLTPESGEREWFGDSSRTAAARRVLYHHAPADLMRRGRSDVPHIHLLDAPTDHSVAMEAWIAERCDAGDAIVVASRDEAIARSVGARVLTLRAGQLHLAAPARARVAERARR
jgi:putative ABC transport system ATP-binding protein